MSDEARSQKVQRPYSPSWVNHLTAWVARRPWPGWYFYSGLWLVVVTILIGALWLERVFPIGTVFPAQLFIPAMISLFLAMIHFLDSRAEAALETLQPALETTDDEFEQLRYRLTALRSWPAILASLATVGLIYLLGVITGEQESSLEALVASPIAASLLLVTYWIGWWVFGAFLYHTVHQLRVINRIYTEHTRVQLFAKGPLYAFSGVTALTAGALAIATYGWTGLNPDNLSKPVSISVMFLITLLALAVFAWPLLGARRLLLKEKTQRLDRISQRMDAVFAEMHQQIDDRAVETTDELTKVLDLLVVERDTLKGISAWPWRPETFSALATALLLPLLLWVIQYILQILLGG